MNSVIGHNPWVSLLAAVLFGMVVKWVMDLFFLRSEVFGLRRRVSDRERDLTDLRHEHGRSLQELKNRLTELDATSKAKAQALAGLAAREAELVAFRERVSTLSAQVTVAEARAEKLGSDVVLHQESLDELRSRLVRTDAELGELWVLRTSLSRDLAVVQSVRDALESAVRSRDESLAIAETELAALTASRDAEASGRMTAGEELARLGSEGAVIRAERDAARESVSSLEQALSSARLQSETATRARGLAEANLKRREMELAENDQRSGEMQRAAEEAAREAARLSAENHRLQAEVTRLAALASGNRSADLAAKALEAERSRLAEEVKGLRHELDVHLGSLGRAEAIARAEEASSAELRLQLAAAGAQRRALEAELEAVSASHALLERQVADALSGNPSGREHGEDA
jgi:chromosome segregation ATPase